MATRLKKVKINRVDMVDVPANQELGGAGAHIMLYKRAEISDVEDYLSKKTPARNQSQETIDPSAVRPSDAESHDQEEALKKVDLYEDCGEDVEKKKLNAAARNKLKDSDFAYIGPDGEKHLPIHDAAHVRNALARLNQTGISSEAKAKAKRKILAAARRFGVNVSKSDAESVIKEVLANSEFLSDNEINELLSGFLEKSFGGQMAFKKEDLAKEAQDAFTDLETRLAKAEDELAKAKKVATTTNWESKVQSPSP